VHIRLSVNSETHARRSQAEPKTKSLVPPPVPAADHGWMGPSECDVVLSALEGQKSLAPQLKRAMGLCC
jgi:hypothetical protein